MGPKIKTRIKIWEEVRKRILLSLVNENYFKHGRRGLCNYLNLSKAAKKVRFASSAGHRECWPEMYKYKPKTKYDNLFWWSTGKSGQEKRLAVVDMIITDLKNSLKKDS